MSDNGTLVDTNVLLDVFDEDPRWVEWSTEQLTAAFERGRVLINPIVYAEVSVGFERAEELDDALPERYFHREPLSYPAGFLAGKAFERYRRNGGTRPTPIADFYIGAHALVHGYTLLTRDRNRYSTYFPKLQLVTP
ncbi:type II toxin-antitoxin system VapC family toxin [uncultured Microbacterium sp.]|uniref:type II toxin-antitoxin system VapC family toxin n=1 Tax=uncultured Microbacterium sp. TaxID=191216 RepID=UPI00260D3035|nr:type II toxin-antitoxin system VapC family toxin [uncultured Microbacterium sp.]